MISTKGLKKSFTTPAGELEVLKGIDLRIPAGEMTAVVGASGVGKSTLLHILGALDRPTSGTIEYEGTDIFSLSERELAPFRNRTIGFVFQFHHLLPEFSAIENVMMPALISGSMSHDEAKNSAGHLLGELGVHGRADHRPGELSGGEQQRVAVARALVLNPKVVLADEPTGNLDTATGADLFRLLQGLNEKRGITFVIVTHNESLSGSCHRIVEMSDGMIRETGTSES
jgi:lipoprotein-releasing system ATP-binding protein